MNVSFQECLPSVMQFLTGKLICKNKFENRFSKPKTGFRFSNRFSINIPIRDTINQAQHSHSLSAKVSYSCLIIIRKPANMGVFKGVYGFFPFFRLSIFWQVQMSIDSTLPMLRLFFELPITILHHRVHEFLSRSS